MESWIADKDCVKNLESMLKADGILTDADIAQQRAAFDAEMEKAIAHAEAAPAMRAEDLYDYLYV